MPVDPRRVKELFAAAIDLPAADRFAFLDRECGPDAELRGRVARLLAAHDAPLSDLERPLAVDATADPDHAATRTGGDEAGATADRPGRDEHVGAVLGGKYKLIEAIGEGGMGSVYMAQQTEPVKRLVAVKVIKAGMDSKAVLARFEAERQALAMMDHPNIARVLDAGTTENGRPFFVMELVKGVPITEFCDERKLTPKQRLELFVPVCQAIQHAHQKGVIHRDIKPSNVLIALYDDKPVPKVIDFGVAKAAGQALTDKTLVTGFGAVVGTPEYMSPEQANLNNLDIDTRSDVYSLGVLLYELLTGSTPVDKKSLGKAALLEILRIVREVEAPKPSHKLSSSDVLPSISACRGTEPAKLSKLMRGELDWVLLKALEKDRTRRYDTANGLARDIQRYLADEIVEARPPSAGYRVRKFVKRHKGQVIAAGLVFFALVAGVAGTTVGLVEARRQAAIAREEAAAKEAARESEAQQRAVANEEKRRAEASEEKAMETFRESTDDGIEQLIGTKRELGPAEKAYLTRTLERWRAFASRSGDGERGSAIRGEAHFRVGGLWQKLGRMDEAKKEIETAREIYAGLADTFPSNIYYRVQLASTNHDLAILFEGAGEMEVARGLLETAGRLQRKLVEASPDLPLLRRNLANYHNSMGNVHSRLGHKTDARREHETARDLLAKLAAAYPANPQYRQHLATTRTSLGTVLVFLKEYDSARREFEAAIAIQRELADTLPYVPEFLDELADTHNNFGFWFASQGRPEESRRHHEAARDLYKQLVDFFPGVARYRVSLGRSCSNLGVALAEAGEPAEALPWHDTAIRLISTQLKNDPRDLESKHLLGGTHMARAMTLRLLGKFAGSADDWEKSIELGPEADRPMRRAGRANMLVKAGRMKEAVAEVADLMKSSKWDADQYYNFACVYALASGSALVEKREYADRAIELLTRGKDSKFMNALHVAQDTDLAPLRARADFKKLLAELEKKFPPPPEVAPPPKAVK